MKATGTPSKKPLKSLIDTEALHFSSFEYDQLIERLTEIEINLNVPYLEKRSHLLSGLVTSD